MNYTLKKKISTFFLGSLRSLLYKCFTLIPRPMLLPSDEKIDVIIPIVEKDLDILPLSLQGIRCCVNNRIEKIYLVSPPSDKIKKFADEMGLGFVEESIVLGYSPKDFDITDSKGNNRTGWIFQQLLKLSGNIGSCRYFLVIDADHILINPHTFLTEDSKTVLYCSKEFYYPYYENLSRLMGESRFHLFSYIAHKMLFDKEELKVLKKYIEKRNGICWDKAIITSLMSDYNVNFSEFELYGKFLSADKVKRIPWLEKSLVKGDELLDYNSLVNKYSSKYMCVTYPDYLGK